MDYENQVTLFARSNARNKRQPFGIRRRDRRYHAYIIGKTGTGKTTLLGTLVRQDIMNGEGLCLIDPHGDLADQVVTELPEFRHGDLLHLNVPEASNALTFNPLENVAPLKRSLVAAGLLEAFKKIWSDSWGVRLEHILRHSLLTLLDQPQATIADILRLFGDDDFRGAAVARVANPQVRRF